MTDAPAFQLRQVHKSHGREFVLRLEELAIPAGRVLCLLGPTGSGKSTLLRLLAGLDAADEGEITLRGEPFRAERLPLAARRRLTLVHQRPMLLGDTVRANVEYGLKLRGRRDARPRAEAMLDRLGLLPLAQQRAGTLSGGQTQLVALARALVIEPEVLLLDEPTANLDPAHVALVEEVITAHQRERRLTVVWATHNLFQARRVAHRVALLLGGRLIELADRETFFESPADPRALDFVQGKMVW
jgi:tungstate transport system ATP-binding protein